MADTAPIPTGDPATGAAAEPAAAASSGASPRHRGRRITSWVLVVLIFGLTPLTLATGWTRLILSNEQAYVAATAPLANEAEVQAAIEDRVTQAVMTKVESLDLDQQLIDWLNSFERMPDKVLTAAQALASSLNQGLESIVRNAVTSVLTSSQFQNIWDRLQTATHQQFTAIMDGTSVLLTEEGGLALQLQPVVAAVRQQLVDNGHAWAANIPDTDLRYDLVDATQTNALRGYYKLATSAFWVIFAVWIVVAIGAVLLAVDRLAAVVRVAVATILGSLLLAVGLRIVENKLTATGTDLAHPGAISAIFNDVLRGLRDGLRIVVAVAFVVAVLAWVFSSGRTAVAVRRFAGKLWGPAADEHAVLIRRIAAWAVTGIVGIILLFADLGTGWTIVLGAVLLAAVVLALLPGGDGTLRPTDGTAVASSPSSP
ncbi:hypothetical protein [Nakamurella lactea]|uniref:hypothetical protein n=1 Tax=Nakamurella lactea TaxID=459515 RepID=UPI0003F558C9|nr:hypothetical protein [Nakamurella lactea]